MKTIEISSYPRSGNTWFRYLIYQFLVDSGAYPAELPCAIHQNKKKVIYNRKQISIPNLNDKVSFYKSHIVDHPAVNPDHIIYIYRHPLDVFLSSLNYFFLRKSKGRLSKEKCNEIFIRGMPKKFEEIFSDGELIDYYNKFKKNLGENFYRHMLGIKSNYFFHVISALNNPKVVKIKYEELIENTAEAFFAILAEVFGLNFNHIMLDIASVNKKTKESENKDFYWKCTSGTRFYFFPNEIIEEFEYIYDKELKAIGYL